MYDHGCAAAQPQPGDWGQIEFGTTSAGSLLDQVIIEYGGGISSSVVIKASGVTIRNSTIARSGNGGIRVEGGAPTITRSNLTVSLPLVRR